MKTIIAKLFTGTITDQELEKLHKWLEDPENQSVLETYIRDYHDLNMATLKNDVNAAYKKVAKRIENKEKPIRNLYSSIFKYAAAVLIFVSVGYFFLNRDNGIEPETTIVNKNIKVGTDKATLTLEDGTNVILEKGQEYISGHISSNGEEVIYSSTSHDSQEIAYNYLTVPRGAQFALKLADGTQVWLNSESRLRYPIRFKEGDTRKVELLYGEAYFDVSPSSANKGAGFKVLTDAQEVEVLGTEFNINAYADESHVYTTLVEGKVAVNSGATHENLIPGEQASFSRPHQTMKISKVDVYSQVSWKEGIFSFRDKPLKDIMNVLSRWYDFNVSFENKALENDLFGGVFSKDQDIKDILKMIENSNAISFEISDKTIIVK